MDLRDKYEQCQFIIGRFDHYYDSVNNKGNLFLVINTFIIGLLISGNTFFQTLITDNKFIAVLIIIITISSMVSILLTILAVSPFLNSGDSSKCLSLIYFGSIASRKEKEFLDDFQKMSNKELETDMLEQIYCLSIGLKTKYQRLRWAGLLLTAEFGMLGVITIILISK